MIANRRLSALEDLGHLPGAQSFDLAQKECETLLPAQAAGKISQDSQNLASEEPLDIGTGSDEM